LHAATVQYFYYCRKISSAVKLGEGSFGEVFKCTLNGEPIALKIIFALHYPHALVVSDLLQRLCEGVNNVTTGFIKFPGASVVKGKYPVALLKAWNNYTGERINESPKVFKATQKYVLLSYELGGMDLENFKAFSIVYQAAYALAVAEVVLQFEHRDLHCGNILINHGRLNGRSIRIRSYGVQVKLIDFTLSRLSDVVYYDLKEDEEIFLGTGALHCEYYREMRKLTK
uniref:Protein kinase domain-containing protein n=1 Tax=Syphacia muris TaxID=451379 RepID=A0A0N5ABX8_9BILA